MLVTQKHFHLFYCTSAGIVIVCHFVRSLMAFVCQEIKGLLTYLLTYLLVFIKSYL